MGALRGVLGLCVILGVAWVCSTDRRAVKLRTIFTGVLFQVLFAFLVLRWQAGRAAIAAVGTAVDGVLACSFAGSRFVFGALGERGSKLGFTFAFQVLPTIVFVAALFAILYHFGVMQLVIDVVARVMRRLMGVSGVEALDVAASIFMGQTEAPLTIRPYLSRVTRSELMVIMTAGMAHVSGGIMAAYILSGVEAKHLLTAVIMTAPGTLTVAKTLVPETEAPETAGRAEIRREEAELHENVLAAAAKGTHDGLLLAVNVAAMLVSFLALIALVNAILGTIHDFAAGFGILSLPSSLEQIFGLIFAPVAWLIGVPWRDCGAVGNLLGTRMVLNELVAFTMLGAQKAALDPRSFTIATFALCGFANISSIGIQIGGLGALAPNRRADLARLGFRAMIAGTMANLMSAAIAGMFL